MVSSNKPYESLSYFGILHYAEICMTIGVSQGL